jgi:hypothetical protein
MVDRMYLILGLSLQNLHADLLLRQFRLLDQSMLQIPLFWFRFTETINKDIMKNTFRLLNTWNSSHEISTLHLLAIVDPNSCWFDKWMLSQIGKSLVVSSLCESEILESIVDQFTFYSGFVLLEYQEPHFGSNDLKIIQKHDIQYLNFVQITSIIKKLILSSQGRRLFPLRSKSQKSLLTIESFITTLVKLLYSFARLSTDDGIADDSEKRLFRMHTFITGIIKDLANSDNACVQHVYHPSILNEFTLLLDVVSKQEATDPSTSYMKENCFHSIAESLSFLSSTAAGRQFILDQPEQALLKGVLHLVTNRNFTLSEAPLTRRVIGSFIFVLRQFYRSFTGFDALRSHQLHHHLSKILIKDARTIQDQDWNASILDNILNFGATPQGLSFLIETGLINECMEYMYSKKNLRVSKCERFFPNLLF